MRQTCTHLRPSSAMICIEDKVPSKKLLEVLPGSCLALWTHFGGKPTQNPSRSISNFPNRTPKSIQKPLSGPQTLISSGGFLVAANPTLHRRACQKASGYPENEAIREREPEELSGDLVLWYLVVFKKESSKKNQVWMWFWVVLVYASL